MLLKFFQLWGFWFCFSASIFFLLVLFFQIVLLFAVTSQNYEKWKCVSVQISYFYTWQNSDFSTWFWDLEWKHGTFVLASFPKEMKLVWLFPLLHKPEGILKVIKFLKNFMKISSDAEFIFSQKKRFSAGVAHIDTWRYPR